MKCWETIIYRVAQHLVASRVVLSSIERYNNINEKLLVAIAGICLKDSYVHRVS
jgi:hypothetical protein